MSTNTIKWDYSEVKGGVRVRTAVFQDHVSAQELTDTDNKAMQLRAIGTFAAGEFPIQAEAKRAGRTWTVSVYTSTLNVRNYREISLRPRPIHRFGLTKNEAIDFMLEWS